METDCQRARAPGATDPLPWNNAVSECGGMGITEEDAGTASGAGQELRHPVAVREVLSKDCQKDDDAEFSQDDGIADTREHAAVDVLPQMMDPTI